MRVVFQYNDVVLEFVDFKEENIPQVEEYFYNPYARGNTFPRREFYSYVEEMKEFGRKQGYMKYSDFPPQMEIYLD